MLFAELKFGDIFEFRPRVYWGFPYAGLFRQRARRAEERACSRPTASRLRLEDPAAPLPGRALDVRQRGARAARRARGVASRPRSPRRRACPACMHAADVERDEADADADAAAGGGGAGGAAPADADDARAGAGAGRGERRERGAAAAAGAAAPLLGRRRERRRAGVSGAADGERVLNANLFVRASLPATPLACATARARRARRAVLHASTTCRAERRVGAASRLAARAAMSAASGRRPCPPRPPRGASVRACARRPRRRTRRPRRARRRPRRRPRRGCRRRRGGGRGRRGTCGRVARRGRAAPPREPSESARLGSISHALVSAAGKEGRRCAMRGEGAGLAPWRSNRPRVCSSALAPYRPAISFACGGKRRNSLN